MNLLAYVPLLLFLLTAIVAFRLAWNQTAPEQAKRRSATALIVVLVATPLALPLFGLRSIYQALNSAEASEKSRLLANGISEAMNCFAFGVVFDVGVVLVFVAATIARKLIRRNG